MVTNSKEYNKKNYDKYWGKPSQIKARTLRNQARKIYEDKGILHKNDSREVDHVRGTSYGNGDGNLQVLSRLKNRQKGQKKAMS
jgi:hypothetical protein